MGAGIVGLATALFAQRAGARVVVLEAREVAAAATGNNTGKLSSLQGLAYSTVAKRSSSAAARYAAANDEGMALAAALVNELSIECDWRRTANYTYGGDPADAAKLERELEASRAAGLNTDFVDDPPLPFGTHGAVRLRDQVAFDPAAFARALAAELDRLIPTVFERSRVVGVGNGQVTLAAGHTVSCDRVILATHLPIFDRVGLFARAEPMASFAIAAETDGAPLEGMFIDAAGKYSLRGLSRGGQSMVIVGGQGDRLGEGDPAASLAALQTFARERFGTGESAYHWDAHDFVTEDRLPFVGSVTPRSDRVLAATGMNKWGLALGLACGRMLAQTAGGAGKAWPDEFDSQRLPRPRSWPTLARNGVETGAHLVGDRLRRGSAEKLAPGEGAVVGAGLGQRAAYRDRDGELHELSARCTHLGCIVKFNQPALTWDCPCHGSRFALDGSVLEGPASSALAQLSPSSRQKEDNVAEKALEVYLNDHLGGATLGSELAAQIRDQLEGSPMHDEMTKLAAEIEGDREALLELMDALDVSRNPVKQVSGWLAEKASRVKFSGASSGEPDHGLFMAIESLRLGVAGKKCLWLALISVRANHPEFSAIDLDALLARAQSQEDVLERTRIATAAEVFAKQTAA